MPGPGERCSKSHKHRLDFQRDPESLHYLRLNLILKRYDLRSACATAIDDGERMTARRADAAPDGTFCESCLLYQPGCRQLPGSIACGIAWQLQSRSCEIGRQFLKTRRRNDRVFEERANAMGVFVAVNNQHCFTPANFAHRVSYCDQCWLRRLPGKMLLQVRVTERRLATLSQRERDAEN